VMREALPPKKIHHCTTIADRIDHFCTKNSTKNQTTSLRSVHQQPMKERF